MNATGLLYDFVNTSNFVPFGTLRLNRLGRSDEERSESDPIERYAICQLSQVGGFWLSSTSSLVRTCESQGLALLLKKKWECGRVEKNSSKATPIDLDTAVFLAFCTFWVFFGPSIYDT